MLLRKENNFKFSPIVSTVIAASSSYSGSVGFGKRDAFINRAGALTLNKNKAWHIKKKLNINLLKKGAKLLQGTHDFSTFRASSCSSNSPIKKINAVHIKKKGDEINIEFKSKSFLQNQVRSMVGSLEYLSCGKWTLYDFKKALKSKK